MGRKYIQLTEGERNQIYVLLQEKVTQRRISEITGRNVSTISREIRRNKGERGYRPIQAQKKTDERRVKSRKKKMTPEVKAYIKERLNKEHSPEQISGTMDNDIGITVSHETIYKYIWKDKRQGGEIYKKLRIAGGRKTRKRYGKKDWRGKIPNRIDIDQRPAVVNEKSRIGDWEADLVCGTQHRWFLVTLVERKSKYTLIGKVRKKNSDEVKAEIIRLLAGYNDIVKTITYDNGREFASHESINKYFKCQSYFAKPYHSWERGLNENTNGLIRQYFPKGMNLRDVTREQIEFVMDRLNNRPRKTLAFKTPNDIFADELNNFKRVALVS